MIQKTEGGWGDSGGQGRSRFWRSGEVQEKEKDAKTNNLLSNQTQREISYRLYLGSAGWAAGQLDEELKIKSWIVCPAKESFVFHPEPDKLWRQVLRSMGGQYALLSTYPPDPILN